jgi:hypothetical protein
MLAFLKKLFQHKTLNAALDWQKVGNQAGKLYWLYAAPVHLVLQRDSFSLAEPAPLTLESDEIVTLTAAFNQHFEADKIQFFWHEDTWFLCLVTHPNIHTSAPEDALNKDISAFMPSGEGATKWASFINEVQMLLFEHPVNTTREAKRMLAINSIWCYGGGQIEHEN